MVYDIVVNYKKIPYEFYEWNKGDNIINVKEILSYKVSSKTLFDFYQNDVVVDSNFLAKIKDKTLIFYKRSVKKISYACVLYDDNIALSFLFDKEGNVIGKSKLLFEESDEIVENKDENKIINIDYMVLKVNSDTGFNTRKEKELLNVLYEYINKIYKENKLDELKYIYFECFNEKMDDEKKIVFNLRKKLKQTNYEFLDKMMQLIKVLKN